MSDKSPIGIYGVHRTIEGGESSRAERVQLNLHHRGHESRGYDSFGYDRVTVVVVTIS